MPSIEAKYDRFQIDSDLLTHLQQLASAEIPPHGVPNQVIVEMVIIDQGERKIISEIRQDA